MTTAVPREIQHFRQEIDAIDMAIVTLLAKRVRIAHEVARIKQRHRLSARLPDRIEAVLSQNAATAVDLGLDPDAVRRIWSVIIEETCRIEESILTKEL